MKTKKIAAFLLCAAMLISALAACGNTTDPSQNSSSDTSGKTVATEPVNKLVVALTSTTVDVGPFAPSSPSTILKYELWGTLFVRPYYGAPIEKCVPYIAKSYKQVDEYTYEVELYDYVKDSKGNPIKADDVVFSFETSATVGQFTAASVLEKIEKIDDTHVRMTLNTTAPGQFANLVTGQQLTIVNKNWYENASEEERSTNPATTGPYYVTSFTPGSGAVLTANENFWQTDKSLLPEQAIANAKEITYKVITEASMRVIALENHEVDIAAINASDLESFYDVQNKKALEGWTVSVHPGTRTYSLFMNMDAGKSPLADSLELRQAVMYALDSEQIMLSTGNNDSTAKVLHSFGCYSYDGYSERWNNEPYYECDPAKAKELIAQAGKKPGEVTIRILSSSGVLSDALRSVVISELEAVGFKVENLAVDQALFNKYKNDSSQWDIMFDVKAASTGHISDLYNKNFNPASYKNGSVCFTHDDKLVELLNKVMNDATEENIYNFGAYLRDNAICMGLYTQDTIYVAQEGVKELKWINANPIVPGASDFWSDFKSAAEGN